MKTLSHVIAAAVALAAACGAAEIPQIQPDYVLDERDFTPRVSAGKQ